MSLTKVEKNEKEDEHKDITKIIKHFDQELSELDNEYSLTRMTIISDINKLHLQLMELEFTYKTEKMRLVEKRNKFIGNKLKIKKDKEKNKEKPILKDNIIV